MARPDTPAWNAVLLVCKACRKRGDGPVKLKPKELASALKDSVRAVRPRPRVLLTSCLGLCPKRATAVARVGGKGEAAMGEARIAAIESVRQLEKMLPF